MQVHRPQLNPLAESALREIQAQGIAVTPDIVLWVQDAAERIRARPTRTPEEMVDWPILCGGATLYPISFAAVEWIRRLPVILHNDTKAIGYACHHAHDKAILEATSNPKAAIKAINEWVAGLTCSPEALEATVARLFDGPEFIEVPVAGQKKPETKTTCDYGVVIRALCSRYTGTTPDHWLWGAGRDQAYKMLEQSNTELPDDQQVSAYEMEANIAFRAVISHIINTAKAEEAKAEATT